jgi:hypothetical protein
LHAYSSYDGLGQVDESSFLGGSLVSTFVLGLGIIWLFNWMNKGGHVASRTRQSRKARAKYVSYVARQHKLSRAEQKYLMEHDE